MPVRVRVGATARLPGWHRWATAPQQGSRSYLAQLHRHLFAITAEVEEPLDHGVEFHDLQDAIREWWGDPASQHDRGSCEAMAIDLARALTGHGLRPVDVWVSEDGEAYARWSR